MSVRTTRHQLDAVLAQAALHDLCPVGDGAIPCKLTGWRNAKGKLVHVVAEYPNGWSLRINFDSRQSISSYSALLKFKGQTKPKGRSHD